MSLRQIMHVSVGLLAFLISFEAAIRIEDRIRWATPLLADAVSQADLILADSQGVRGRPNGRFRQWALDSLGFRGPEVDRTPLPGTVRVVALGASETFGLLEAPDKEFPRQLEDSLNDLAGRHTGRCTQPPRYEVVNAALPGMYLPTAVRFVRGYLATLSPDVILFYPTPHQYLDVEAPRSASTGVQDLPGETAGRPWRPRSPGRVRDAAKELLPASVRTALRRAELAELVRRYPAGWEFDTIPASRIAALEADLRLLVGAVRQAGAIPILATHANRFQLGTPPNSRELLLMWRRYAPRATEETILAFESAANEAIRRVAADSGVAVAAVDSTFSASGSGGDFGDYIHFTDEGAGRAASAFAPVVAATTLPRSCQQGQPAAEAGRAVASSSSAP